MAIADKIITVDPSAPDRGIITHAARIINGGGVVVFPAFCLYGLAADATNPEAVRRVFDLKKRPPDNPVLILIKHSDALKDLVTDIPAPARKIMDRFWPGRVTLVFHAAPGIPGILTAGTGNIGIRVPEHPVAAELTRALPFPITGTSANLSGTGGCVTVSQLPPELVDGVDLILDAGPLKGGLGSTVVDVTCDPARILREGAVSALEIFQSIA
jgi:L-threonylcarbamoyladenylate synthase